MKKINKSTIKTFASDLKAVIKTPLPGALKEKYLDYIISAIAFFVASIIVLVSFKSVMAAIYPLLLCVIFVVMGISYKWQVLHGGYYEVVGTIIDYGQFFPIISKRDNVADSLIIETPNRLLQIPARKRKSPPPKESRIIVYIPVREQPYITNGVECYAKIFGYTIMPAESRTK